MDGLHLWECSDAVPSGSSPAVSASHAAAGGAGQPFQPSVPDIQVVRERPG